MTDAMSDSGSHVGENAAQENAHKVGQTQRGSLGQQGASEAVVTDPSAPLRAESMEGWSEGRPRLLDLFCCEGGASMGYWRAGFDVFGVDLFEDYSQARYPFPSHKGDAIEFVKEHGHEFDAIHASPPCQHASAGTRALRQDGAEYPALIPATRDALVATGLPYVIENVRGSALLDPIELCGCMFRLNAQDDDSVWLRLERTRLFESNVPLRAPSDHWHPSDVWVAGCYGGSRRQGDTPAERRHNAKYVRHGGYVPSKGVCQALLGIDWMTWKGMHQALPPIYTHHIGEQLRAALSGRPTDA